jgi:hypothetical protein
MIAAALGRSVGLAIRALAAPGVLASRVVNQRLQKVAHEAPIAPPTLGLAAKVVLDEVFFLTEALTSRLVSLSERGRLIEEAAEALALYETRGWLDDPAGFHPEPPRLTAPMLRWGGRSRGLDYVHLESPSEYEPHAGEPGRDRWLGYAANRTAHAWLLRHPGAPRPWLVCVHAYRMGFPFADFLAFPAMWLHRQLGLNVAFPTLPLHGRRKIGWRTGDGFLTGDYLDTIHLQAQAVWDVRRLIGWLRAEAGAPAVGVYGLSLGGNAAALLAGLEDDLACLIAGIPPADLLGLARWNVPPPLLQVFEHLGLMMSDGHMRLMRVISPLALAPRVPRERRFLFAAMADRLVPRQDVIDLWKHWDRPRLAWYAGTHVSFGWEREVRSLLEEALVKSRLV